MAAEFIGVAAAAAKDSTKAPTKAPMEELMSQLATHPGPGSLGAYPHVSEHPIDEKLTVVTYMNEFDHKFGYLQISASEHGLHPQIVGYSDTAWWPDGLGAKVNRLRSFVLTEVHDRELVLFVDAFDVMVLADREEIVTKFQALEKLQNRSLFFNAEKDCYPYVPDICEEYPKAPHERWRYLNSGLFIGRGAALKEMLRLPVEDRMEGGDQAFYQRYFKHFPSRVGLDYGCEIVCASHGVTAAVDMEVKSSRLKNTATGASPCAVHFVSEAHWAMWRNGTPTSVIGDFFEQVYPEQAEKLFGAVDFSVRVGGSHSSAKITLRGPGKIRYHRLMRAALCIQCNAFRSQDRECNEVHGIFCDMCADVRTFAELGAIFKVFTFVFCLRKSPRLAKLLHFLLGLLPLCGPRLQDIIRRLAKMDLQQQQSFTKVEKAV